MASKRKSMLAQSPLERRNQSRVQTQGSIIHNMMKTETFKDTFDQKQHDLKNIKRDKFSLTFVHGGELEYRFFKYFYDGYVNRGRIAAVVFLVVVGILGVFDDHIYGSQGDDVRLVRYAIMVPIMFIMCVITFLPQYTSNIQLVNVGIATSFGAALVTTAIVGEEPEFGVIMLFIIFNFNLIRLRFILQLSITFLLIGVFFFVGSPINNWVSSDVWNGLVFIGLALAAELYSCYNDEWMARSMFLTSERLAIESEMLQTQKETAENLLGNVLPEPIADKLRKNRTKIANRHEEVSVLFADIVGFTTFSAKQKPEQLVQFLNDIFFTFDLIADLYGAEKVKTIGDCYMCCTGLILDDAEFAKSETESEEEKKNRAIKNTCAMVHMAMEMQQKIALIKTRDQTTVQIRVGIHTGPVVAGVIGIKRSIFDLWGDTVNTASRMESHGAPGRVHISEHTYTLVKDKFTVAERRTINVKGKGEMCTYFVEKSLEDKKASRLSRPLSVRPMSIAIESQGKFNSLLAKENAEHAINGEEHQVNLDNILVAIEEELEEELEEDTATDTHTKPSAKTEGAHVNI